LLLPCLLLCSSACKSQQSASDKDDLLELNGHSSFEDVDAAHPPVVSLADSITLARKHAPDGRLLHAELGRSSGRYDCLAAFWTADGLRVFDIDVQTGELLHEGSPDADVEAMARAREVGEQPRTLIEPSRAISAATAVLPIAWARSINLEGSFAQPSYRVQIISAAESRDVWISATSGNMLPPPASSD
jgi:hypothetical protein